MRHGTGTLGCVVVRLPRSKVCSGVVACAKGIPGCGPSVSTRVRVCFARLVEEMSECVSNSRSVFASCFDYCVSSHEYQDEVTAQIPSMVTASGAQRFGGEISSV